MDRSCRSTGIFNTVFNPCAMDIHQLIDQYAAYDLWANTRIVGRLATENPAILDAHVRSSFPSLRSTLMHIRNAEAAWLARIMGEEQRWPAEESEEIGTLITHSTRLRDEVRALDTAGLLRPCLYKDLKGNAHSQQPVHMLMHCFNHSTYHRGQVITMMRQLELNDIPPLDLVIFQRALAKGDAQP